MSDYFDIPKCKECGHDMHTVKVNGLKLPKNFCVYCGVYNEHLLTEEELDDTEERIDNDS